MGRAWQKVLATAMATSLTNAANAMAVVLQTGHVIVMETSMQDADAVKQDPADAMMHVIRQLNSTNAACAAVTALRKVPATATKTSM
jgi:hypothetical protein